MANGAVCGIIGWTLGGDTILLIKKLDPEAGSLTASSCFNIQTAIVCLSHLFSELLASANRVQRRKSRPGLFAPALASIRAKDVRTEHFP